MFLVVICCRRLLGNTGLDLKLLAVGLAVFQKRIDCGFTDCNDAVFTSLAVIDADKSGPEAYVSPVQIRRLLRPFENKAVRVSRATE